jgi:hypothetical protein
MLPLAMYCGEVRFKIMENIIFYLSTYTYTMLLFCDSREIPILDDSYEYNLGTVCTMHFAHFYNT